MVADTDHFPDFTTRLLFPLYIPLTPEGNKDLAVYYDNLYLATQQGRMGLLCGDTDFFAAMFSEGAHTIQPLSVGTSRVFIEEENPFMLFQRGERILKYDPEQAVGQRLAVEAMQKLIRRGAHRAAAERRPCDNKQLTTTLCAEGLKRQQIMLPGGIALKLDLF